MLVNPGLRGRIAKFQHSAPDARTMTPASDCCRQSSLHVHYNPWNRSGSFVPRRSVVEQLTGLGRQKSDTQVILAPHVAKANGKVSFNGHTPGLQKDLPCIQ